MDGKTLHEAATIAARLGTRYAPRKVEAVAVTVDGGTTVVRPIVADGRAYRSVPEVTVTVPESIGGTGPALAPVAALGTIGDPVELDGRRVVGTTGTATVPGDGELTVVTVERADGPTLDPSTVAAVAAVAPFRAGEADGRPMLAGVLVRRGTVAATDTYRLGSVTVPGDRDTDVVIPPGIVAALTATGAVGATVTVDPYRVTAVVELERGPARARRRSTLTVTAPALEGSYPDVVSLFPGVEDGTVTIPAPAAVAGWLTTAARALPPNTPVLLEADPLGIRLAGEASGTTTATTVPATVTGTLPDYVAVNPRYLASVLGFAGSTATVGLRDGLRALTIAGDGDRVALLMPMRVTR